MTLKPGDLLCYPPTNLLGKLIVLKTWSKPPISHVEVYMGRGISAAARASGVNEFPTRMDFSLILRPKEPFDKKAAQAFMERVSGQKYDYLGLVWTFLAAKQGSKDKMYCSELATRLYRAAGIEPFHADYDADRVAPATFLTSAAFRKVGK